MYQLEKATKKTRFTKMDSIQTDIIKNGKFIFCSNQLFLKIFILEQHSHTDPMDTISLVQIIWFYIIIWWCYVKDAEKKNWFYNFNHMIQGDFIY